MTRQRKRIVTIVGARPQFIKAAPVSAALAVAEFEEIIVHTGQHFDAAMSDVFFEELGIKQPSHHLNINSLGHGAMTGRMIEALETILVQESPDLVVVFGDTNSTLAGAVAAAKLHIPVAHVEAGLRSFNRRMPEEINRVLTDHASDLLLCPTATAVENLRQEGMTKGVLLVGDVMFDATLQAIKQSRARSRILDTLSLSPKRYFAATVHRAENTDDEARFADIFAFLRDRTREMPVVLAVHPRTRKVLAERGTSTVGLRLIEPLGYLDMTQLLNGAAGIFTDSGGIQKEAYFHRVPCVTLREDTEWVETITNGWNRLWRGPAYRERHDIEDYGTGHSSPAVAKAINEFLG
jgi:UDP-GlcNAc3NAcA epimerase